jgi:hypothetical protein
MEIDTIKEFTEKMRELGYGVDINVSEKPSYDYTPPKYDTKITLGCFKRTENNDASPWNNFNLSFRLDTPQKHEPEKADRQLSDVITVIDAGGQF